MKCVNFAPPADQQWSEFGTQGFERATLLVPDAKRTVIARQNSLRECVLGTAYPDRRPYPADET